MPVIDLTRQYVGDRFPVQIKQSEIALKSAAVGYTGVVYEYTSDSMMGSYIDFPGHIKETDNGEYADNFPLDRLYRVPASIIRLNRRNGSGAVSGAELEAAFGGVPRTGALIINALGELNPRDVETRSVYLDHSALDWIVASGCKLLVSDIYESRELHGAFLKLFQAGISTVCEPVNLAKLTVREVRLTVLFPLLPGMTQLPCRMVAEF